MFEKIAKFFSKAWKWIQALWDKHDEHLEEMVRSILPMVIEVTFRSDLDGEQKKKAIIDAIIDNADAEIAEISHSLLNEAVEIAVNRYNIQIGKTTVENMDASLVATQKAARDYTNNALKIAGTEAEDAGIGTSTVVDVE